MDKAAIKAAKALAALLDSFYRLIAAVVMGILGLVGIAPRPTARDVAREVLADDGETVDHAAGEAEESPLGFMVRAHARAIRWAPMPGDPVLQPLPPLVKSWLDRMDQSQLSSMVGMPAAWIEQHVLSGDAGQLKSLLGPCTADAILARPIRPDAAAGGTSDGRSGKGGRGGGQKATPAAAAEAKREFTLEQIMQDIGMDVGEVFAPRR
jgi:hypothetical protein